jgi:hypothetical protein
MTSVLMIVMTAVLVTMMESEYLRGYILRAE